MESVQDIFCQYSIYLENEQVIKDSISNETKTLDKINNSILVSLEKLHNGVEDSNISETCSSIKLELEKAKYAYCSLQSAVPNDQFYRYNSLFKMSTQKLVMAAALLIYLSENRLLKFEEAAQMLGLQIFSTRDLEPEKSNEILGADESKTEMMKYSDSPQTSTPDIGEKKLVFERALTDVKSRHQASEPNCAHPPGAFATHRSQEDLQPIVQMSASPKSAEVVLAPSSPRPSSDETGYSTTRTISLCDTNSSTLDASSCAVPCSVGTDSSLDTCIVSSLTLKDDMHKSPCLKHHDSSFLYLDLEDFLIGTLKIGSELARLSVNAVACGNFSLPYRVNQFLRELHAGYTLLHLRNSYLRKSYDELKYCLKKTEDVVYNLSVRGLKPSLLQ